MIDAIRIMVILKSALNLFKDCKLLESVAVILSFQRQTILEISLLRPTSIIFSLQCWSFAKE